MSCRYQAVCAFAKFSCVPGVGVQHRSLRTYCKLFLEWALWDPPKINANHNWDIKGMCVYLYIIYIYDYVY